MRTHPLNVSHLVLGLVFLGIAGTWALHSAGVVDTGQLRWLLPLTLVLAGTVGLVAFAARRTTRRGTSTPSSYDDTEGDLR